VGCLQRFRFLLGLALASAPLEMFGEDVRLFSGTITARWVAQTSQGANQFARLKSADGRSFVLDLGAPGGEATIQKGDEVVLTAEALELDGEPVLRVKLITERIPAR
jgi:hypothetical protein